MNVYTMYFSPTGGTRRVARILAGELNAPVEMDFSLPGKNYGMYRFEPGDVRSEEHTSELQSQR